MFDLISVLLALVLLFGAAAMIGRVGRVGGFSRFGRLSRLRKAESMAEANGDRERAQALRKIQSDINQGQLFRHHRP